jgi:hypothetical protein
MHLVQLLLPLYDNDQQPFTHAAFDQVRNELAEQFRGVTAWRRSPAEGVWQTDDGQTSRDDIVIFEVMVDALDRAWWGHLPRGTRAALSPRAPCGPRARD